MYSMHRVLDHTHIYFVEHQPVQCS
jgi:hypothetical protein